MFAGTVIHLAKERFERGVRDNVGRIVGRFGGLVV
jgi:hypothetical protein